MDLDLLIFLDNIRGGFIGCKFLYWMFKNRLRKKRFLYDIYFSNYR